MKVLVTGSAGFIGSNLVVALQRQPNVELYQTDVESTAAELQSALAQVELIFHLAGVNRPILETDFLTINGQLAERLCKQLCDVGRSPKIVLASSIQAELDNPYGRSKLYAEQVLERYAREANAAVVVHRLKNLFGKWCRPNYNSVTATFCHNIARDLPVQISDPERTVSLTYIDDVIGAFLSDLNINHEPGFRPAPPLDSVNITLGNLAELLHSFRQQRQSLLLPNFSQSFTKALYATYLSYLDPNDFAYSLTSRADPRGSLAEFVKQCSFGQLFVSRTKPGVTRGNHYHDTKTEKFLVVQGQAVIRFRHIAGHEVQTFSVSGEEFRVVDIPPGFTHSIENVGQGDLVTLFWASEIFNREAPDTYTLPVLE